MIWKFSFAPYHFDPAALDIPNIQGHIEYPFLSKDFRWKDTDWNYLIYFLIEIVNSPLPESLCIFLVSLLHGLQDQ